MGCKELIIWDKRNNCSSWHICILFLLQNTSQAKENSAFGFPPLHLCYLDQTNPFVCTIISAIKGIKFQFVSMLLAELDYLDMLSILPLIYTTNLRTSSILAPKPCHENLCFYLTANGSCIYATNIIFREESWSWNRHHNFQSPLFHWTWHISLY